jgi:hypothetical protein
MDALNTEASVILVFPGFEGTTDNWLTTNRELAGPDIGFDGGRSALRRGQTALPGCRADPHARRRLERLPGRLDNGAGVAGTAASSGRTTPNAAVNINGIGGGLHQTARLSRTWRLRQHVVHAAAPISGTTGTGIPPSRPQPDGSVVGARTLFHPQPAADGGAGDLHHRERPPDSSTLTSPSTPGVQSSR